jgi:hypothetical protein
VMVMASKSPLAAVNGIVTLAMKVSVEDALMVICVIAALSEAFLKVYGYISP